MSGTNTILVIPVPAQPLSVVLPVERPIAVMAPAAQGLPGAPGEPGTGSAMISTDPDNQLIEGSDDGLFVPEPNGADYLALYYLARG